jgi:hypothetical protein
MRDLLLADVDALMVSSCQELSGQIICAANEVPDNNDGNLLVFEDEWEQILSLALHFADPTRTNKQKSQYMSQTVRPLPVA